MTNILFYLFFIASAAEPTGTITEFQSLNKNFKFEEFSKQKEILNGPYTQWYLGSEIVRVSGNYVNNLPDGEWKFFSYDHKEEYKVYYSKGKIISIVVPHERPDSAVHVVSGSLATSPRSHLIGYLQISNDIAFEYRKSSSSEDKHSLAHSLLYSDVGRKNVAGIVVDNFRFVDGKIGQAACDHSDGENKFVWKVFEKIGTSCLVQISDVDCKKGTPGNYWVECSNFEPIADFYKKRMLSIKTSQDFFNAPNGKVVQLKPLRKNIPSYAEMKLLELKHIKGEDWAKIRFESICDPDGDVYKDEVWVKLWENKQPIFQVVDKC